MGLKVEWKSLRKGFQFQYGRAVLRVHETPVKGAVSMKVEDISKPGQLINWPLIDRGKKADLGKNSSAFGPK